MEWLKKLLGDKSTDDLVESIKKGIGEHFVPNDVYKKKTSKVQELESELETAQSTLEETNESLKSLKNKAGDYEDVKEQLENLNQEYEEYKEGETTRLAKIRKTSALEKLLLKSKADENAVDLLINDFNVDEIELDDDGEIKDQEEVLKPVKEKRPTLFGEVEITGDDPKDGDTGGITDNPFKIGSINLTKQGELVRNKPEVAKRLIKAAGKDPAQYKL